jgi:hypothetical protein
MYTGLIGPKQARRLCANIWLSRASIAPFLEFQCLATIRTNVSIGSIYPSVKLIQTITHLDLQMACDCIQPICIPPQNIVEFRKTPKFLLK